MKRAILIVCCVTTLITFGVATVHGEEHREATSLLGEPLVRPTMSDENREFHTRSLDVAQRELDVDPEDAEAIIWLGRRTAYLGRYRDAIEIFGKGIEKHPNDPRMFRHRGHRYITIREIDLAIADFTRATELIEGTSDEVEPDGLPNARNQPTSTLHGNIWYHLGLAHYLKGDFELALESFQKYMATAKNDDSVVAGAYWLWMILGRLGHDEDAGRVLESINDEMDVIENQSYHRLCLMFKGDLEPDEILGDEATPLELATVGYGVGNWHLIGGDEEKAFGVFGDVIATDFWPAFGYVAAESEVARRP